MYKNMIGDRVRIARSRCKPPMPQANLLARLQVNGLEISQSILSKIENGTREVNDFELAAIAKALNVAIAKALNVDIRWLLKQKETAI